MSNINSSFTSLPSPIQLPKPTSKISELQKTLPSASPSSSVKPQPTYTPQKMSPILLPNFDQQVIQFDSMIDQCSPEKMHRSTPSFKPSGLKAAIESLPEKPPTGTLSTSASGPLKLGQEALVLAQTADNPSTRKMQLCETLEMANKLYTRGHLEESKQLLTGVQNVLSAHPDSVISHQAINLSQKLNSHGRLLGGNGTAQLEYNLGQAKSLISNPPIQRAQAAEAVELALQLANDSSEFYQKVVVDQNANPSWASQQWIASSVMYEAGDVIHNVAKLAADTGDLELFRVAENALKKMPVDSGKPENLNIEHLALMDDIEVNENGSKLPQSPNRTFYPFPTKFHSDISLPELKQINQTTLFIQAAVKQAHEELLTGNLVHFEGSGTLDSWRKHAALGGKLKSTEAGQLIEYRTMNLIAPHLESREDGKYLNGLKFEMQKTVYSGKYSNARPDIVLTSPEGRVAYVDVTSNSNASVGHVLTKGKGVLQNGHYLAETTYQPIDSNNIQYDPNNPPNVGLSPEQIQAIKQKQAQIKSLTDSLEQQKINLREKIKPLASTDLKIGDRVNQLNDKLFFAEFIVTDEDSLAARDAFLHITQSALPTHLSGVSYNPPRDGESYNNSIRMVAEGIEWMTNPAWDKYVQKGMPEFKAAVDKYVATLDEIDRLRAS